MCTSLQTSECASYSHCQLLTMGSTEMCIYKCEGRMTADSCNAAPMGCSWNNGMCHLDCPYTTGEQACLSNPACGYWASSATCYTKNCSVFGMDAKSCGGYGNSAFCTVGPEMQCMASCSYHMMNESCMADDACYWNAEGLSCHTKSCGNFTDPNTCAYRPECTWIGGNTAACKPSCSTGTSMSCGTWDHCWWDSSSYACLPKCTAQATKSACLGSNANWFKNAAAGPCFWASDSLGCQSHQCSQFRANSTACSAASFCVGKYDDLYMNCIASCGRALTEADCKNPFFSSGFGCAWDSTNKVCAQTCEFMRTPEECTGDCMWNANFSVCAHKMMAPSTTAAPTNATNSTGEQTPAPAPTNATTNSSSSQTPAPTNDTSATTSSSTQQSGGDSSSSSTTATGGSSQSTTQPATTQTPTTAAPTGNPRVVFAINQEHRANTTSESFKNALMSLLNLPANAITVTYDESSGVATVEFNQDATDGSGNALNATAEFEKAVSLDSTQLASLGAASATSAEPAPVGGNPAPEDDGPDVAVIAGAAAGGFVFLLIVLFIIKKQTSGGTGAYLEDDRPGDRPMLQIPEQQRAAPA